MISFVSKGFLYKDQIEELFDVVVYCMYSQRVTSSTFSLSSLFSLQHTFQRHDIAYCAESAVKLQSVNRSSLNKKPFADYTWFSETVLS